VQRIRLCRCRVLARLRGKCRCREDAAARHARRIFLGRRGGDRLLDRPQGRADGRVHDPGDRQPRPPHAAARFAHAGLCGDDRVVCVEMTVPESALRAGEVAVELPPRTDAEIYFIATIRTPWKTRQECPKRGTPDGPICTIVFDERWRDGLTGLAKHKRVQVLYWMHEA